MPDEEKINPESPEVVNPFAEALNNLFTPKAAETATPPKEEAKVEKVEEEKQVLDLSTEKKEEEPKTDDIDSLLSIDPAGLKTKTGIPVTEASRASFKKLQESLKRTNTELIELKKKLEEKPKEINLNEIEEYKKALEEKERYKKEIDAFAFENSDEWKNTYEVPIQQRTERVNSIIAALELDDDDARQASSLIRTAQGFLGNSKDEFKFSQVIDKIADSYIKSPTAGKKFVDAMTELFDLTVKRAEAKADKEKARIEIQSKYQKQTASSQKMLEDRLEAEMIAFENSDLGKIFKSVKAKDFDYESTSKANREKALRAVRDFQVTGQVTSDLAEMTRYFVLKPALEKEREFFIKTNIQLSEATEKLLKENEELKKRVLDLRGEGRQPESTTKPGTSKKNVHDPFSVFAGIEKVLG